MEALKRMAESDPTYTFAFRTMVANKPAAEDLLRFVTDRPKGKPGSQKK